MRLIIKARSLTGACNLARNQGFNRIASAVYRDGYWRVTPCLI